jgi:O-antigen/teichoic acid export membrane protein
MQLSARTVHAFKWSILGESASRLITPLVFLVLARLLLPEDFGVIAAATVVISFSQTLAEAGLAKALIQRQGDVDESANVVFWLNLVFAGLIMALLLLTAPVIASFFHDPRIADVIRLLSLQVFFTALCSVHTALLQKELKFKELFWVRLLTAGTPALAAVPLALNGMGYWALVAGTLLGQLMQAVVLWLRNDWRPHWGLDTILALQLIQFGKWAMFSGLLGWLYGWLDAIIVGRYLGSHDMGLYRTSNALVTMLFGLALSPLLPVLYSLFSRLAGDLDGIKNALMKSARLIMIFSFPMAMVTVILSEPIQTLLLGPAWVGASPIIALLAVGQCFAWLVGANGEAYRALGRPELETWVMAISIAAYSIGYLVSIQYGLLAFVATRVSLVLLGVIIQIWMAHIALRLRLMAWIRSCYKPALFSVFSFAVAQYGVGPHLDGLADAAAKTATVIMLYAVLLSIFEKDLLATLRNRINAA